MWFTSATREAYEAHKATDQAKKADYGKYIAEFLQIGSNVTDEQYRKARQFQKDFSDQFRTALSAVDAFAAPGVWNGQRRYRRIVAGKHGRKG
jgi:Asp-tRNA(Asn)/Glu-tRNA(Gln) amidotransferase A subunit family amidase